MVAPIPKNTVHSTPAAPPSGPPVTTRSSAPPPPAAEVRHQAADDVHTLQTARTTPAARANPVAYQRAVDEAARTYLEGGGAPLRVLLGQDGAMLSTLANVDAARLERDLTASFERQSSGVRSLVTGVDAGSVAGIVESVASDRIRLGIVQEAQVIVTARIQDLRAMRDALPELLPALRNARPGTLEAIQAQALGIRGDEGDLARARASIQESIEGFQTFMGRTRGQAWWQASDFPAAADRSARRANLGGSSDSATAAATARDTTNEQVHHAVELAEGAHILWEAGAVAVHALQGAAVAAGTAGLAVSVIGLLAGRAAYHMAEAARAEHVEIGRSLGL
ncbi:MAG: hypothetical protein IPL19_07310 [Sandaracinaceae bacterium]|jgi:hypothetical protein|nr:hypothetical protein [Sandaracinaceae bacterium]MBK7151453.1 hypothetical protein [Sandaracinaceae bacterium]MBK8407782.1 hypothetical protein [Sandaracinaceae bacterium]